MLKINLDYHTIKNLREKGKTWSEISQELGVSVRTLTRFSQKNGLKLGKPYQYGKRMCDSCRHFFNKSNLKSNVYGQFCLKCYEKSLIEKERRYGSPIICDVDCEV